MIFRLFLLTFLYFYLINAQKISLTKHCGLPPNINELPDFAQDELNSVWKDYIPGNKCEKEMQITEDILAVLVTFEKELQKEIKEEDKPKNIKQNSKQILNNSNKLKQEFDIPKGRSTKRRNPDSYGEEGNYNTGKNEYVVDEEEKGENEEEDVEQQERLRIKDLPFLRGASPDIIDLFRKVIDDPEFPTEKRRLEEIQLLAVSYLNTRQLAKFDAWATTRRKIHN
uniref:Uncharacterized protein n=3 Tax=Meloidogyne TaxID=189290 RepID=A0A914MN46_MELIC